MGAAGQPSAAAASRGKPATIRELTEPAWLSRVAGAVLRYPRAAAFGCGVLATLAMPPVFAWPVLFVVFACLVRLLDRTCDEATAWPSRLRGGLVHGWLFGFGYFATGLYWISASLFVEPDKFLWLLPFSATLIPAGLAVFYAVALAAAAIAWLPGLGRIVALALALTVAEWLRGHLFTGLPWNTLGYALTAPPYLMQSASILGTYALTFAVVLIFALPAMTLWPEPGTRVRPLALVIIPCLALAVLGAYGKWQLSRPQPPAVAGVRLRLVQPNISQDMKWRFENRASIFRGYLDLSRRNPDGQDDALAGITHVIWPESAIPFLLLSSPEALEALAGLLPDGTRLVTGAIRVEDASADGSTARRVFNSILALDDRGQLIGVHDKRHLVPFGEYLPFQRTLEALGLQQLTRMQGGFASGASQPRYWEVAGLPPMSALVCYESIFPDEVVTAGRRPAFFLNVTNDGWFGRTAGPYQHLHQSRIRAVEQGLPLVRVANTGISAVIDGRGRIVGRAGLGERAVIDADLPPALAPTLYSRMGDAILIVLLAGGCLVWSLCRWPRLASRLRS